MIDLLFDCLLRWLAPMIPFTCEEAWAERHQVGHHAGGRGNDVADSVHLELFPEIPASWRDVALDTKWEKIHRLRRVVLGALEEARVRKEIGSSLEAKAVLYLSDPDLLNALGGVDMAEIAITSVFQVLPLEAAPQNAFRLPQEDAAAVAIVPAPGRKCARSWKYAEDVGSDPDYPDVTTRDAAALRESTPPARPPVDFARPSRVLGLRPALSAVLFDQAHKPDSLPL